MLPTTLTSSVPGARSRCSRSWTPRVSDTAILHLQNGLILPSFSRGEAPGCLPAAASTATSRASSTATWCRSTRSSRSTSSRRDNGGDAGRPGNASAARAAARDVHEPVRGPVVCPAGSDDRLRLDALARRRARTSPAATGWRSTSSSRARTSSSRSTTCARSATRPCSRRRRARSSFSAGTRGWSRASTSTTRRRRSGSTAVARDEPGRPATSRPRSRVVGPVYGCAGLPDRAPRTPDGCARAVTSSFELVFVDDRSPDGAWAVARRSWRQRDPRVRGSG